MRDPRRALGLPAVCLLIACLALLAACAPSGAVPSETPGGPTLNGCRTQQAPTNLPTPDVTLTQTGRAGATPTQDFVKKVAVARGRRIEVRLPANVQWGMGVQPNGAILRVEEPQSWYSASPAECVWRLSAIGAGITKLEFSGGLVCPPGRACIAIAAVASYEITVA